MKVLIFFSLFISWNASATGFEIFNGNYKVSSQECAPWYQTPSGCYSTIYATDVQIEGSGTDAKLSVLNDVGGYESRNLIEGTYNDRSGCLRKGTWIYTASSVEHVSEIDFNQCRKNPINKKSIWSYRIDKTAVGLRLTVNRDGVAGYILNLK